MLKTKKLLIREMEIEEALNFNLKEMEMMVDLMGIPKYKNSSTLIERYRAFEDDTKKLIGELADIKEKIDNILAIAEILIEEEKEEK